ncbi:MAG: twin-arginine translocation signal domain-containing protein [Streptosporangiaceae bacterium]|jgi:hypothetical protein
MVPDPDLTRHSITRRGFIGTAGVAGTAAVALPGRTTAGPLSSRQRDMVLAVARVAAVFPATAGATAAVAKGTRASSPVVRRAFTEVPARFPVFTQFATPTASRVLGATGRLSAQRLALTQDGADALLAAGLLGQSQARLLDGIASYAGSPAGRAQIAGVVTLAIAAWSGQQGSDCENLAETWTGVLTRMRDRGTLAHIAELRGIR